jgi:D-alanyl-D-alanine dipeptidase
VDLTLYDLKTGRAAEMPSLYDEMSERAYPTYAGAPRNDAVCATPCAGTCVPDGLDEVCLAQNRELIASGLSIFAVTSCDSVTSGSPGDIGL